MPFLGPSVKKSCILTRFRGECIDLIHGGDFLDKLQTKMPWKVINLLLYSDVQKPILEFICFKMYYDTGKYLVKKYCARKTENKYYFIFFKLCMNVQDCTDRHKYLRSKG